MNTNQRIEIIEDNVSSLQSNQALLTKNLDQFASMNVAMVKWMAQIDEKFKIVDFELKKIKDQKQEQK